MSDSIALGLRGDYLLVQESGNVATAKRELHSRLPVTNPNYGAALDVQWVPVYAKASLFNTIIQFDNILLGGAGFVSSETRVAPLEPAPIPASTRGCTHQSSSELASDTG